MSIQCAGSGTGPRPLRRPRIDHKGTADGTKRENGAKDTVGGKTASGSKPADRDRGLLIRVNPEGQKELRILAAELDRTIHSLGVEAFNNLLEKQDRKPVIKNPRLE